MTISKLNESFESLPFILFAILFLVNCKSPASTKIKKDQINVNQFDINKAINKLINKLATRKEITLEDYAGIPPSMLTELLLKFSELPIPNGSGTGNKKLKSHIKNGLIIKLLDTDLTDLNELRDLLNDQPIESRFSFVDETQVLDVSKKIYALINAKKFDNTHIKLLEKLRDLYAFNKNNKLYEFIYTELEKEINILTYKIS